MTKIQIAKKYLSSKLSVIPVGRDKKPLIDWKKYQQELATEKDLEAWFKNPDTQIGIVTGKISNLIVVDIEKGGDTSFLPETTIASTGGGGWHYYYKYAEGVNNATRIRPLVDIRGEGGYVVAPGSESTKGKYEWFKKDYFIDFPVELFGGQKKKKEFKEGYAGYAQGERNDKMAGYIGSVVSKVHPSDWETIAWSTIKEANSKNTPPLLEQELRATFESIVKTEKRNNFERWKPKVTQEVAQENLEDVDDSVVSIKEACENDGEYSEAYPIGYSIFDNAMRVSDEKRGGLRNGDLAIITGISGNGKTTFAMNITAHYEAEALPILWFSFEVLKNSLWGGFKQMGVAEDSLIYTPKVNVTGKTTWIEEKIRESQKKFYTKIIIIDHIDFLSPTNRNSIDQYRMRLRNICLELKTMAIKNKVVIILMAHVKKVQGREIEMQDIAESAGIYQLADFVFSIGRKHNIEYVDGKEISVPTNEGIIKLLKNRLTGKLPFCEFTVNDNIITPI